MGRIGTRNQQGRGREADAARRRRGLRPTVTELEGRTLLSTWTVTKSGNDDGTTGTLSWAVGKANADGGGDTIAFATAQNIVLNNTLELTGTAGATTITGPVAGVTVGSTGSRIFQIDGGVRASISGLTITNGGLLNYGGTLTLTNCSISHNFSLDGGGGLEVDSGSVTLTNCTINGNTSGFVGGGLKIGPPGTATLTNCTVSGNSALGGGGLYNNGTATLINCTVSGGNSARFGGGLSNYNTATLTNTIVAGNNGDIFNLGSISGNYNLIGDGSGISGGTGNLTGDPKLAPLGDYGGPTPTMALLPGSPAIGAGDPTQAGTTDQRGYTRGGRVDIGAINGQLWTVTSTADSIGAGTLRGAIEQAKAEGGGDTIVFSSLFNTPQTIELSGGQLELTAATIIRGPAAGVTVSGGNKSRVFLVDNGVQATISGLTITGGNVNGGGGGLYNEGGTATLTNCTISGNTATLGGGLEIHTGTAALINCTISGNNATLGGGLVIDSYSAVTLTNCTISGNTATLGGGGLDSVGTTMLTNTIVADNSTSPTGGAPSDIAASPRVFGSYNLIGTGGSGGLSNTDGNQVGVADPGLDPDGLQSNGGPTQTIALLPGSPAIGAGNPALAVDPTTKKSLTADQRGYMPASMADIGAFQDQGFVLTPVTGSNPQGAVSGTAFANPLAVIVSAHNAAGFTNPVDGGVITFTAPSSGASATLSATTATIAGGRASVVATANTIAGSYSVTASAAGVSTPASFSLINTPASVAVVSGSPQSVAVGHAFSPLVVVVKDRNGNPVPGVIVTFTVPASGASAILSSATATTDASGQASVTATAGTTAGHYTVIASVAGLAQSASFNLTNPEAPSLVVNTTQDVADDADGLTSLREAIAYANSLTGPVTITFDPHVFSTGRTITLTGSELELSNGNGETIIGPAAGVTVSGNHLSRVFQIDPKVTASISGLTIADGSGGVLGGGVYNQGALTLTGCTLSGNSAVGEGGGLFTSGTATLTNCTVDGNSAGFGGGITNIGASATITLIGSTISNNSGTSGGGLTLAGAATLTNCTITGNTASDSGGGLRLTGSATLTNCTISFNSAPNGGGVYDTNLLQLFNTIVAGNSTLAGGGSPSDISATPAVSGSYDLIGTGGSGGLSNTDGNHNRVGIANPGLDPNGLQSNGGPTRTIALLPGSPAIGAGDPALAVDPTTNQPLTTDQRGYMPASMADIGAFQNQGFVLTPVTGSTPQGAVVGTAFANPLAVTVSAHDTARFTNPVNGGVIAFTVLSSGASATLSSTAATIAGGRASVVATANTIAGSYSVTPSVAGRTTPVIFILTNMPGAAASVAVVSGSGQSTTDATAFANPLVVVVKDTYGNLVPGASVTFAAPGAGASASITGSPATTGANGQASVTATANPVAGSYSVTASVSGVTIPASFSLINTPDTATLLSLFPNPSTVGQTVAFTATVFLIRGGPGTPTGTVEFFDGTTLLGNGTLNGTGTATFTTSSLAAGSHAITAQYLGDANDDGSTSAVVTQVVQNSTATALASSPSPSTVGQTVIFTATVTPISGTGTPTGTVQFFDGTTPLGTANLNPSGTATFTTSSLAAGSHAIRAEYLGDASDAGSYSAMQTQTVNPVSTTTALGSSASPSPYGQTVTFTATVTPTSGTATPAGTVQFFDGTTQIGSSTLNANGTATFAASSLAVGSHSISAGYLGDPNDLGSTSGIVTQVVQNSTTTALTSSPNPSKVGQNVTFTATVTRSPGTGTPTGTVQFYDGTTLLGSANLNGSGTATFASSKLAAGNHAITARYLGDANDAGSTSATVAQVVQTSTKTTLTSSLSPSTAGQAVTFTATVTPTSGTATATGTVQFFDGTTLLGSGTLNASGAATFATTSLALGNHAITARYLGDPIDLGSTSQALTQTVQNSTTTALVSSLNPTTAGQNVNFTATVSRSPGTGTPTGTVQFYDGTTLLGTANLNPSGTATFTTNKLAAGSHAITARYLGDANDAGSTSVALTQVVQTSTTTTLVSSLNPSTAGQAVTFTATVTPTSGTATPTGTVQFYDGTTLLDTETLNTSGKATFTTSSLAVGSHAITVKYLGDTIDLSSTSQTLTQKVNS
jgi:parallel beta-helix repeat protein